MCSESLQQPTDTSVPPGKGCASSFCTGNSLGTVQLRVATQDSWAGLQELAWPLFHIIVIRKTQLVPWEIVWLCPSDTPELVTGNVHVSMSCAVDLIPCQSSSRRCSPSSCTEGLTSLGLGLSFSEAARALLAFPCSLGNVLPSCSQARAFQWCRDDNTTRHCHGCLCSQSLGFIKWVFLSNKLITKSLHHPGMVLTRSSIPR